MLIRCTPNQVGGAGHGCSHRRGTRGTPPLAPGRTSSGSISREESFAGRCGGGGRGRGYLYRKVFHWSPPIDFSPASALRLGSQAALCG